jgi:hypothetical protein
MFTGYINNSVLYLKYGEYQGSCIVDDNYREIDLEYLLKYLNALHAPTAYMDAIEVKLQAPYNQQTIKLSNKPYLNEIATSQQKVIMDLSNRISALEEKRLTYKLRFSLKDINCYNKSDDFNGYLKAINAQVKSYQVNNEEIEFVVRTTEGRPHNIIICRVEDSSNYNVEKQCNAIEVNKQYYIDVQKPNYKFGPTFNTIVLKVIQLNFNDKEWYLVD